MSRRFDNRRPVRAAFAAACLAAACAALLLCPARAPATGADTTSPATGTATGAVFSTTGTRAGTTFSAVKAPTTLYELQAAAEQARLQMQRLETQMMRITARYDVSRTRLDVISEQLVSTRLRLARTQAELDRQSTLVSARIVDMYKRGDYTWIDFLFSSDSLSDWRSQVDFFNLILEQDRHTGADLEGLNDMVEDCEAAMARQRDEAIGVQAEIDAQRNALDLRIEERRAVLVDLTGRIREILERRGAGTAALDMDAATRGVYSPLTWARELLQRLGMPVTADNVAAIVAWEMAEGGHWHNTARYNPLNTTQPMPGATAMNSVGVKAYTSWAQGFQATVITLHNGYYGRILAALRKGDDAIAVAVAVGASPWGTGNFSHLL